VIQLRDLLDEPSFKLDLLVGGDSARERRVAGVHVVEAARPARFLPRDYVMITLGLRLQDHEDRQRELVHELDNHGACALGFGIGEAFADVPGPLLEEAAARNFPVFEIPFETQYRDLIRHANRSLLSADVRHLQRALSMQNYLMDSLRASDPVRELVQRLGSLLHSRVLIFTAHGSVIADSGASDASAIWDEVVRSRDAAEDPTGEGNAIVAVPLQQSDHHSDHLLVISSRSRALSKQLRASVIQTTERLLELITLSRQADAVEERMVRAELLEAAITGSIDPLVLQARFHRSGFRFESPTRIFVIGARDAGPTNAAFLVEHRSVLERVHENRDVPYLISARQPNLVLLTDMQPDELRDVLREVDSEHGSAIAGGGRPVDAPEGIPSSLADGELALEQARKNDADDVLVFEAVPLTQWVIGMCDADALHTKAQSLIGPIEERPDLIETLRMYLDENASVAVTAQRLHLHQNSVRYRLTQIERLLDVTLADHATLTELRLALMALA
jgi:purine catabolism regulator